MDVPDADAPLWLRQRWDTPLDSGAGTMFRDGANTVATPGGPKWIGGSDPGLEPGDPDWYHTKARPGSI